MSSEMQMPDENLINRVKIAHGILAALAWVVFFPAGAISIRLWHNRWTLWVHGITQTLAYLFYIVAVCLGLVLTQMISVFDPELWQNEHIIIGLIILGLAFIQPVLGFVHHAFFKKVQRRTFWGQAHLWIGRILITAGMINGGLGLYITQGYQANVTTGEIVYGVFAGLIFIVYVCSAIFGEVWKKVGTDMPAKEVIPAAVDMVKSPSSPTVGGPQEKPSPSDSDSDNVSRGGSNPYQTYYANYDSEKPFRGRGSGSMKKTAESYV